MTDAIHDSYLRHAGTILALANVYRGTEHANGRREDVATHTLMVVALTLDLATLLGLDEKETLKATNAALCHDYAETITGEIDTLVPLTRAQQAAKGQAEARANGRLLDEGRVGNLLGQDFDGHWLANYADKLCPILVGIHDDARRLHARGIECWWLISRKVKQFDAMLMPEKHRETLRVIWDDAVDDLADRLEVRYTNESVHLGEGEG